MIEALVERNDPKSRAIEWLYSQINLVRPNSLLAYLTTLALVAIGVGLRVAFGHALDGAPFVTLFPAIIYASMLCGARAATVGVLAAALAAWYLIVPPTHSFVVGALTGWERLALFALGSEAMVLIISAMRNLVRSLRKSNSVLRALYESNPDALLVIGEDGVIEAANEHAHAFFGYGGSALLGVSVEALVPEAVRAGHGSLRAAFLREDRSRTMALAREVAAVRRDGVTIPVEIQLGPIHCGGKACVIATVRDISREKAIAQAMAEHALPDALFIHDFDGRFLQVNRKACESTGYGREELLGMRVTDIEQDFDLARAQAVWNGLAVGASPTLYGRHRRKDGAVFPVEISFGVLGGGPPDERQYIAVARDLTELNESRERIAQFEKVELLGELTSGVAHDFNNVLAAIVLNLDTILRQPHLAPRVQTLGERAVAAAMSGAELTRRLLAFGRKAPLQVEAVDLNEIVSTMLDMLRRTLASIVDIEVDLGEGLWIVMTDRARVESALLNLVINARDAMPDGGRLTIRTENRRLDGDGRSAPGDYAVLSVSDTGVGMSPQAVLRAKEPFYTTKPKGKGTGLGLSMIDRLARQAGGALIIDSEPERGATVSLALPRAEATAASPSDRVRSAELARGTETILVVEDISIVGAAVSAALETLGYRIVSVANPHTALAILAGRPGIDLVFSDIDMPGGLSGTDLAHRVRAEHPGVQVLLTTEDDGDATQGRTRSPDISLIAKPYQIADLADAVRAALDQGRARSAG